MDPQFLSDPLDPGAPTLRAGGRRAHTTRPTSTRPSRRKPRTSASPAPRRLTSCESCPPPPWSHHNWVLENVESADAAAQFAPAEFQADVFRRLFTQYVVDVVERDPTIVRAAYWKCRDDYRWR